MNYDDIINLPHFHAEGKPYMSNRDRSAQFMPFKSLKGFDDMVGSKAVELETMFQDDERYDDTDISGEVYFEEEIYYS